LKILVIGSGGREHALAWKCAQSPIVDEVIVAPGNAGTEQEPKVRNAAVGAEDIDGLIDLAQRENVELTIVGPEVPLVHGITDRFENENLACFGPCAAAAQLEGSKAFTKEFLEQYGIPTADYQTFDAIDPAIAYVRSVGAPTVIKADGLAAGKGVVVALSLSDAEDAIRDMLGERRFGDAGQRIVIEEFLQGEEASFMVVTDGTNVVPFASSQDHKARDEGDKGPNTGGMGAYSPAPVVTDEVRQRILDEVIQPTLAGLRDRGIHYCGFLYAGLMITPDGTPKVIEFNCRLGDPETQPILMRLESDLVTLCKAALEGDLGNTATEWDSRAALGVVMAAGGYPESYQKGYSISGLESAATDDCKVFHAGTLMNDDGIVTSGGRVLCVVGLGDTVADAHRIAYERLDHIEWDGAFCRRDIGYRALQRESADS